MRFINRESLTSLGTFGSQCGSSSESLERPLSSPFPPAGAGVRLELSLLSGPVTCTVHDPLAIFAKITSPGDFPGAYPLIADLGSDTQAGIARGPPAEWAGPPHDFVPQQVPLAPRSGSASRRRSRDDSPPPGTGSWARRLEQPVPPQIVEAVGTGVLAASVGSLG